MITPEQRAANDERVADDIRTHGCHVVTVFDPEGQAPNFSYSIGIEQSTGAPEAIVIGLDVKLGHRVINEYLRQIQAGTRFVRGEPCDGFLEGFPVLIEPAKKARVAPYMLGCARYYGRRAFTAVQIVYPTTRGVWPWEPGASQAFRALQPMLGRARPDRP
ncbi:DUF4262 domain-containing protein [Methyloversatilis thermotolerans]|uniref:DUF4262 domain-containing protein n=1 Tax=Methyloversatilis thermotolerans TaxID=1346290 RepID=UPI0004781B4B|nr:DUF4262 domain-containing protein [Methyloversatilis thermotolerans]